MKFPSRGSKKSAKSSAASRKSGRRQQEGWLRRGGPTFLAVGFSLVVVGGIGTLPAKTWLAQRRSITESELELERLSAEVAEYENQLELIQTDGEVERTARLNFDLVYPGEESYRILPAVTD